LITDADTLQQAIRARMPDPMPRRLGVAVSGGSDSTALLRLLAGIAKTDGIELHAATVDHGLRPESGDEAALVATLARSWSIPHTTLVWRGWDGTGNLQDQARRVRYALLTQWAKDAGATAIALGHTADDQAETVLMRLSRAAGVSGLSAMAAMRTEDGIDLLRPMLSIPRAQLRSFLAAEGIGWIDDPSNQDSRFDRIKTRSALSQLDQIGITAETLTRVADNLAQAREALAQYAQVSARRLVQVSGGDLCVDHGDLLALPMEIQRRMIVAAVAWIAGQGYPPRQGAVDQALNAVAAGRTTTIGGCLLVPMREKTWICRELRAVADQIAQPGTLWDNRWIVTGPSEQGRKIRALGEDGIAQVENWRDLGKPRAALLSTPSVWSGQTMLSAPLAGQAGEWQATIAPERPEFYASILSH